MTEIMEVDWGDAVSFHLRDYQLAAQQKVREGWASYSRQLLDMATGTGKTTIFSAIAAEEWDAGGRTLVLENRDALVRQTARRIHDETGLEVDIEMAGEHASPFAPIVVASVPTLCRDARLTGFADNHFSLLVCDECHHAVAKSFKKVCSYFHYGAESLAEGWAAPPDGTYQPKARILGVTATPDIGDKRNLGEIFQSIPFSYQLFQAVRDGWLVPPVAIMEPLAVNFKGLRATRTPNGSDYNPTQVAERIVPVIDALAKQFVKYTSDRKTMAFMPSVKTAEMMANAIIAHGLKAIFVSGECLDRGPKTDAFVNHGPGIVLCTAALYTEGFDVPDVDAVFPGITKSRSYFRQKVGRATRVLPGIVDGLATADERRAAIAASAKTDFIIIDPFCKLDNEIELCDTYDLYTDNADVKEQMKAIGPPSQEVAEKAERDMVKALEKAAKKAQHKATKVIDPLAWAVTIGDEKIKSYVPEKPWEMQPVQPNQIAFLQQQHVDMTNIKTKGLANRIIAVMVNRMGLHLATVKQLDFMKTLGLGEHATPTITQDEASRLIGATLARRKAQ